MSDRHPAAPDELESQTLHTQIAPLGVPPAAPAALIVDVEPRSLYELSTAFRAAGYRTFGATSFADAKRLLVTEQPQVLVADVRLGEFNGIQLLILAREVRPGISAVITNACVDSVLADETHRLGGTFVVKPLAFRELLEAVEKRSRLWAESNPSEAERRLADRRKILTPNFSPERRELERRRTT
jgi:DNA-binding NtrC family response regulator